MDMQKLGALAGFVLCLAGGGPVHAAGALGGQAAQAARIVDAFHAALGRGDASAAGALLDEQAVIYEEGEAEQSKAAYTSGHLPADIAFLATAHETLANRTGGASGALAWVASQGHLRATVDGRVIERETTETMVLHRTSMGWRIVHVHWSSAKSASTVAGQR